MKPQRVATVVIGLGLVGALAIGVWSETARVPNLQSPLTVSEAYTLADGGTLWVGLVDAQGKSFGFGLKGEVGVPRERMPLLVQRWVPMVRELERDGATERQLARLARRAASDNAGHKGHAKHLALLVEALELGKRGG